MTLTLRSLPPTLVLLAALAACSTTPPASPPPAVSAPPPPEPVEVPADQASLRRDRAEAARAAAARAETAATSPASRDMRAHLAGIEQTLIARGRLRTDDGSDIALTPEKLAEDFIEVALRDEYTRMDGKLISRSAPAPLRRWQQPVRLRLEFGDSVDHGQRERDRAEIAAFAARLERISGHPVSLSASSGNVTVLIVNEDERRAIGPRLAALVPGIPPADITALTELSPQNYCTVFAYAESNAPDYSKAVVLIRAELPPRLRRSCLHEELTQGMGLANDGPRVRPSIFNDDEEFAYLTRHDELLLKVLYDPRLHPGMTEAEARPLVYQIARELLAGTS